MASAGWSRSRRSSPIGSTSRIVSSTGGRSGGGRAAADRATRAPGHHEPSGAALASEIDPSGGRGGRGGRGPGARAMDQHGIDLLREVERLRRLDQQRTCLRAFDDTAELERGDVVLQREAEAGHPGGEDSLALCTGCLGRHRSRDVGRGRAPELGNGRAGGARPECVRRELGQPAVPGADVIPERREPTDSEREGIQVEPSYLQRSERRRPVGGQAEAAGADLSPVDLDDGLADRRPQPVVERRDLERHRLGCGSRSRQAARRSSSSVSGPPSVSRRRTTSRAGPVPAGISIVANSPRGAALAVASPTPTPAASGPGSRIVRGRVGARDARDDGQVVPLRLAEEREARGGSAHLQVTVCHRPGRDAARGGDGKRRLVARCERPPVDEARSLDAHACHRARAGRPELGRSRRVRLRVRPSALRRCDEHRPGHVARIGEPARRCRALRHDRQPVPQRVGTDHRARQALCPGLHREPREVVTAGRRRRSCSMVGGDPIVGRHGVRRARRQRRSPA